MSVRRKADREASILFAVQLAKYSAEITILIGFIIIVLFFLRVAGFW